MDTQKKPCTKSHSAFFDFDMEISVSRLYEYVKTRCTLTMEDMGDGKDDDEM